MATGDPTWPRVSPQRYQCGLVVSLIRYDTGAAPMRTTQITMEYDLKHPKIANGMSNGKVNGHTPNGLQGIANGYENGYKN